MHCLALNNQESQVFLIWSVRMVCLMWLGLMAVSLPFFDVHTVKALWGSYMLMKTMVT